MPPGGWFRHRYVTLALLAVTIGFIAIGLSVDLLLSRCVAGLGFCFAAIGLNI